MSITTRNVFDRQKQRSDLSNVLSKSQMSDLNCEVISPEKGGSKVPKFKALINSSSQLVDITMNNLD